MEAREKVAREHGEIKVFLRAEEVALLANALTWLKADLASTVQAAAELETAVAVRLPQDVFSHLQPVIDLTRKTLIVQSIADFDERRDDPGKQQLHKTIDDNARHLQRVQQLRDTVLELAYAGLSGSQ